jgi:hypothetical protein
LAPLTVAVTGQVPTAAPAAARTVTDWFARPVLNRTFAAPVAGTV